MGYIFSTARRSPPSLADRHQQEQCPPVSRGRRARPPTTVRSVPGGGLANRFLSPWGIRSDVSPGGGLGIHGGIGIRGGGLRGRRSPQARPRGERRLQRRLPKPLRPKSADDVTRLLFKSDPSCDQCQSQSQDPFPQDPDSWHASRSPSKRLNGHGLQDLSSRVVGPPPSVHHEGEAHKAGTQLGRIEFRPGVPVTLAMAMISPEVCCLSVAVPALLRESVAIAHPHIMMMSIERSPPFTGRAHRLSFAGHSSPFTAAAVAAATAVAAWSGSCLSAAATRDAALAPTAERSRASTVQPSGTPFVEVRPSVPCCLRRQRGRWRGEGSPRRGVVPVRPRCSRYRRS